jgi:hypothetical protein
MEREIEDALVLARVDDVVPDLRHRDEEVGHLVAERKLVAVHVPCVRRPAGLAGGRDQGRSRVGHQVRDGEGVPGAASPPQCGVALDGEAEVAGRERVRQDDPASGVTPSSAATSVL